MMIFGIRSEVIKMVFLVLEFKKWLEEFEVIVMVMV